MEISDKAEQYALEVLSKCDVIYADHKQLLKVAFLTGAQTSDNRIKTIQEVVSGRDASMARMEKALLFQVACIDQLRLTLKHIFETADALYPNSGHMYLAELNFIRSIVLQALPELESK